LTQNEEELEIGRERGERREERWLRRAGIYKQEYSFFYFLFLFLK
jgi:hypothetical protein